jgi:hypothetical protein
MPAFTWGRMFRPTAQRAMHGMMSRKGAKGAKDVKNWWCHAKYSA